MAYTGYQLSQELQVKVNITPEFKQNIQILQFSAQELSHFIQTQLDENPFLDVASPNEFDMAIHDSSNSDGTALWENIAASETSLTSHLEEQLRFLTLSSQLETYCHELIGSLDEHGYLDWELCKRHHHDVTRLNQAREIIQSLDPAGVGARSLAECITLQLVRKQTQDQPETQLAVKIASTYLPEVAKGDWHGLGQQLGVSVAQVQQAVMQIKACHPRPCANFTTSPPIYVVPDVTVTSQTSGMHIQLNDRLPQLQLNPQYQFIVHQTDQPSDSRQKLRNWQQAASWLLRGISQRQHTLLRMTEAILEKQHAFFSYGPARLIPLTLGQIATMLDLHESTISRATKNKYMQTPHGLFPFRYFFPSGFGEDVTTIAVKARLQALIHQEPATKPYSDQKLADLLTAESIGISRRTVTKYRKELGIASSSSRRH